MQVHWSKVFFYIIYSSLKKMHNSQSQASVNFWISQALGVSLVNCLRKSYGHLVFKMETYIYFQFFKEAFNIETIPGYPMVARVGAFCLMKFFNGISNVILVASCCLVQVINICTVHYLNCYQIQPSSAATHLYTSVAMVTTQHPQLLK